MLNCLSLVLFCSLLSSSLGTWEELFMQFPNEAYAYEYLSFYTSMPHVAGTDGDYETAQYTQAKFQEFGLDSEIWPFQALVSWPISRQLELVSPFSFTATLQEDIVSVDPSTYDPRITPTFNGYSPSGDVTAELVYVNYGTYQDFETLKVTISISGVDTQSMGVQLEGKIAIARYGAIFRGTKVMIAQLYGIAGMLIYSDPADDGYSQGTVFPEGPWRPSSGVQRGSVQFLSKCPGDPRRKICSDDPNYNWTSNVPSIPVQPISWADALPLMQALAGNPVPSGWQGGLNFTYNIGPGPAVVHLQLEMKFEVKTLWNVIAKIEGVQSDRAVILGNHRDAWVFGATDPNSGTAAMLEVARSFSELLKLGWKPQRSIILASWDGEEYGLLGSTAWSEANGDFLLQSAIAYLNVDVGVAGSNFGASATPSLASIIRQAAAMVTDPKTGLPISKVWSQQLPVLGSGSDFTAMLDHFGVAATDSGFWGPYGVYHSVYDDIYWMNNFGDPGYHYHKACAQLWGVSALLLVDAEVLPYNYTEYGAQLENFYGSIVTLMKQYNGAIDLTALYDSVINFQQSAAKVEIEIKNIKSLSSSSQQSLNDRLMLTERQFLSQNGLPGRPYYKHVVQAPGLYEGYAADVFPGLAQAIRDQDWDQAKQQAASIAQIVQQAGNFLAGN